MLYLSLFLFSIYPFSNLLHQISDKLRSLIFDLNVELLTCDASDLVIQQYDQPLRRWLSRAA